MHVLLLASVFPPEVRSAANVMYELAETLVELGHKVTVITSIPTTELGKSKRKLSDRFYQKEVLGDMTIIRISALPIHVSNAAAVIRGIGQILNAFAFFLAGLLTKKIDVSISYSPPLTLGFTGYLLKLFKKIPHIMNLQDLVPQYAIDLGLLKNKFLIKIIKIIEHFIYKKVQYITVHSKGNKDYVVNEGFSPDKVYVVPNWVDTEVVVPADKQNEFREKNHFNDKFIVTFAGVLGFAQDLDTIVESAQFLKDEKDIVILIIGDGVEKERLVKKAEELDLANVVFHPFVSKEYYPKVVAASNVCLASLQKDLLCPVIPSKILGYMSGARPVITSLSLDGDAPYVIQESEGGLCVPPGEPELLAQAIKEMHADQKKSEQMGINGRSYVLKEHSRVNCIKKYEHLFKEIKKKTELAK